MYNDEVDLFCLDPKKITGLAGFENRIKVTEGRVQLPNPKRMTNGELEWEYWVTRLHYGFARATKEDLETIKKIVDKL